MFALRSRRDTRWMAPEPLWYQQEDEAGVDVGTRPAILRFDTDDFMDELMAVLERNPMALEQWLVGPETWRQPLPRPKALQTLNVHVPPTRVKIPREFPPPAKPLESYPDVDKDDAEKPTELLKLYQAGHQRYYLAAGALVELTKGMADRCVNPPRETASFVVRRLIPSDGTRGEGPPDDTWRELAFVKTPEGYRWDVVGEAPIAPGEQMNAMFPLSYVNRGARRRMHAGLIPVARRETYLGTPPRSRLNPSFEEPELLDTMRDPRLVRLKSEVTAPWENLLEMAGAERDKEASYNGHSWDFGDFTASSSNVMQGSDVQAVERIQTASFYIGLDLLRFFREELPNVFDAIEDSDLVPPTDAERDIVTWLKWFKPSSAQLRVWIQSGGSYDEQRWDLQTSLFTYLQALLAEDARNGHSREHNLEQVDYQYSLVGDTPDGSTYLWPDIVFPLAAHRADFEAPQPDRTDLATASELLRTAIEAKEIRDQMEPGGEVTIVHQVVALESLVKAALGPRDDKPYAATPMLPTELDAYEGWFHVRCVFEDPDCEPFVESVLSDPTEPFLMAAFFDPDAPARPVRIPMPMDISPSGLRKFSKSASFVISDMLCSQIKSIQKLTFGDLVLSVLPWPFHKDLPSLAKNGPCGSPSSNFGMICSLSIPIVTLCALLLLMVIVLLLDIFFKWVPLLFMCFPIPGLKAKRSQGRP